MRGLAGAGTAYASRGCVLGLAGLVALGLALGLSPSARGPAAAQEPGMGAGHAGPARAGLVIQMADGSVQERCVALGAEEISGEELLRRAGLPVAVETSLLGTMVCRIGDSGCDYPAESCWCACRLLEGRCVYWAYHSLEEGAWSYARLGAAARRVRHGDVDGWAWGEGGLRSGAAPPLRSFDELCGRPAVVSAGEPAAALRSSSSSRALPTALPSPTPRPRAAETGAETGAETSTEEDGAARTEDEERTEGSDATRGAGEANGAAAPPDAADEGADRKHLAISDDRSAEGAAVALTAPEGDGREASASVAGRAEGRADAPNARGPAAEGRETGAPATPERTPLYLAAALAAALLLGGLLWLRTRA